MRILLAGLLAVLSCAAADDLEKLRDKQDRAGLLQSAQTLTAAAEKNPGDANAWIRVALSHSYIAEVAMEVGDKRGSQSAAEEGAKAAEKALALNPNVADFYRVYGTLCGQVIPANPIMGALAYGRKAKESLDKAIAMDPKSARAYLAHGVGYYYLPVNFGGGPENAMKDFRQALSLDAKLADAYLWTGIAQRKLRQNAQARESFNKALQLSPTRVWAKNQLDKTPLQ